MVDTKDHDPTPTGVPAGISAGIPTGTPTGNLSRTWATAAPRRRELPEIERFAGGDTGVGASLEWMRDAWDAAARDAGDRDDTGAWGDRAGNDETGTDQMPDDTDTSTDPAGGRPLAPIHDARELMQGGTSTRIRLDDKVYTLMITRAGKLILTK